MWSTTTRFWLTLIGKTPRKTLPYPYSSIARAKASFRLATEVERICGKRMTIGVEMPRSATSSTICFSATAREASRVGRTRSLPSSETWKKPLPQCGIP